ncbi:MAG: hypothetical protein ABIJ14_00205 [Nanoarchaeota archaeon]
MKDYKNSLLFWWAIAFVIMFILGMFGKIIWDKSDWIFLFLIVGVIILNVKLNKLLSKNKK